MDKFSDSAYSSSKYAREFDESEFNVANDEVDEFRVVSNYQKKGGAIIMREEQQ